MLRARSIVGIAALLLWACTNDYDGLEFGDASASAGTGGATGGASAGGSSGAGASGASGGSGGDAGAGTGGTGTGGTGMGGAGTGGTGMGMAGCRGDDDCGTLVGLCAAGICRCADRTCNRGETCARRGSETVCACNDGDSCSSSETCCSGGCQTGDCG